MLRTATEPMTTTELANAVLAAHGVQDASKDDVHSIALVSSTAWRTTMAGGGASRRDAAVQVANS